MRHCDSGCAIGSGVRVVNCVLMDGVTIADGATLSGVLVRAIIGVYWVAVHAMP
jgi:NDP-sugar pyrophosphorylase family protein